jgi:hypothetical protein
MTEIDLTRESDDRRDSYGILLTSKEVFTMVGSGIHNPHHDHSLDVWENKIRPDYEGQELAYVDPRGKHTDASHSFLFSALATVISNERGARTRRRADRAYSPGDILRLTIEGFPIGWFQVRARPLDNPYLVPVDVATSASRQFFVETGDYLERSLTD